MAMDYSISVTKWFDNSKATVKLISIKRYNPQQEITFYLDGYNGDEFAQSLALLLLKKD